MSVPATLDAPDYASLSLAPATLAAYDTDWRDFTAWCRIKALSPLPAAPETIASYLASLAATHGRSALRRRISAIGQAHKLKGLTWATPPLVQRTLRGILREHGAPTRQAAALTTPDIKKLLATCDDGLTGRRDRAMILIGYAGALRRSEIVAIEREHLTFEAGGVRLHIPSSKTDQGREGVEIGIPSGDKRETCPVRAMQVWLDVSRCEFGPVFRRVDAWGGIDHRALNPDAVRVMLKRRAETAGLTAGALERISAHGLRAGFVTAAFAAGERDETIMGHTRHRDIRSMRGYVRRAKLVVDSPVKKLGL